MSATGKSDNAIEFSFDRPSHSIPSNVELQAAVDGVAGAAVEEVSTPATSTPVVEAAKPAETTPLATSTPADPSTTPAQPDTTSTETQQASPDDLRTFEIVVDGQKLTVTEADLKAGHMRQRDYTQKTQKLSERERALAAKEADYQQKIAAQEHELTAIDQFLQNQAAIDAYYAKAFGQPAAQPPQVDPNKPVTAQDVARIAAYNAEQVRQSTVRDVEARQNALINAMREEKKAVEMGKLETEIDAHISTLTKQYPVLAKFEDIDDELIGMASKYTPRSLAEAKDRLTEAAQRKVATIRAIADDEKKQQAVAAAAARKTTTEPVGGTPVKPQPGRKLSMDHKDRAARIEAGVADVQAFLDANR